MENTGPFPLDPDTPKSARSARRPLVKAGLRYSFLVARANFLALPFSFSSCQLTPIGTFEPYECLQTSPKLAMKCVDRLLFHDGRRSSRSTS
jgi:hypothetical protein